MIASLFTDRERLLPLVNSKSKILDDTREKIEHICSTSRAQPKVEKDLQKIEYDNFFASLIDLELNTPSS